MGIAIDPAFSTSDADGTRISLVYDRLLFVDPVEMTVVRILQ